MCKKPYHHYTLFIFTINLHLYETCRPKLRNFKQCGHKYSQTEKHVIMIKDVKLYKLRVIL